MLLPVRRKAKNKMVKYLFKQQLIKTLALITIVNGIKNAHPGFIETCKICSTMYTKTDMKPVVEVISF